MSHYKGSIRRPNDSTFELLVAFAMVAFNAASRVDQGHVYKLDHVHADPGSINIADE